MNTNTMPMVKESNNFNLSVFDTPVVNERCSRAQQRFLVKTADPQPVNSWVLENINLALTTIYNTCNWAVLKETRQDNNTETPTSSTSTGESNVTDGSKSNVSVGSNQPVGMSSHCEYLSNLSVDNCYLLESNYNSSNSQNCKLVAESKPAVGENTTQLALQTGLNLTPFLSAPRKIVKKGWPSSKKQKKRQREKRKHGVQHLQTKEIPDPTHTGCDTEQSLHSQNMVLVCDQINKLDSSTVSPCNPKVKTTHETFNSSRTMTRVFGRLISYSEVDNCFEADGEHDNKTEKKTDYALFNNNGLRKNGCQNSSEHGSFNNRSITFEMSVLKDAESCFFTPALSLDILFCKKPTSVCQAAVDLQEPTFDLLDDMSSDENVDLLPSSHGPDPESLKRINAFWNENYPTAGFRSCSSGSTDEIQHPTIKNRFPHSTVIFDMTTATIIVGTVGVILNNALLETVSLTWRVIIGYIISTSLLLFLTICDVTLDVFPHHTAYWVTLISVSAISIGCAVQQSSFYGYANMLPRRYTQAVMVGESFAGVLVSLNRIITKLLLKDERVNTTIFFIISIFVIGICCFTFLLARRTSFVRHHLYSCRADKTRHETDDVTAFKLTQGQYACFEFEVPPKRDNSTENTSVAPGDPGKQITTAKVVGQQPENSDRQGHDPDVSFKGRNSVMYGSAKTTEADLTGSRASLVVDRRSNFKTRLQARWVVTKQIYPYMTSFGLTFYVSVSLYPGIISEVVSCRLGTWMPVLLMACFNLTDAFGKTLTSIKQTYSKLRILLCSLARFCLIPLAIMCCKPRYHPILSGEAWSILVTIVLGASNGYFGSLPLVLAPSQVAPRHRELCGNTMMLSFTFGVICGAATSYGLDLLIGPHPDMEFCNDLQNNTSTLGMEVTGRTIN